MNHSLTCLWILLSSTLVIAAEGTKGSTASAVFGGGLALPGTTFLPHAFDTMWHGFGPVSVADHADNPTNTSSVTKVRFRMALGADDKAFDGTATFSVVSRSPDSSGPAGEPAGSIRAEWRLVATADAELNETYVGGNVPFWKFGGGKVLLDGRDLPLPAEVTKQRHLYRGSVTNLTLIDRDGIERLRIVLDAPTRILLQDDRHWKTDDLSIRFFVAFGPVKAGAEYTLAATFTTPADGPLALVPPQKYRLAPDADWVPLKYAPWIEAGSALDFTDVLPHHAPAGKFGHVLAVGDHFEFEGLPDIPQRFYGVNLCGTANLPESRGEADRFAANLARIGYNAVRIHHHEKWLVSKDGKLPLSGATPLSEPAALSGATPLNGANQLSHEGALSGKAALSREAALNREAESGTALDPAQMEKLDTLVASCIAHGLYITTDLYVSRAHVVSWRALGIDRDGAVKPDAYKILVAFYEPAFSNLCAWTRTFLGHVNPHTGRSLAQEPALCSLALVNEGNLGNFGIAALRDSPGIDEAWENWLSERRKLAADCNRLPAAENQKHPLPSNLNDPEFAAFLAERETVLFERLKAFVRDECGCKAPLSTISAWYNPLPYQLTRTHFDYVDNHFYVDHPQFLGVPWRLPSRCPNVNPFRSTAKGAQKAEWYRLMDKPFCVTEFNYSGPGRFRGVGGVALGTLAALQDWSGLWRFAWSHSRDGIVRPGRQMGYFDVAGDPLALAAERAGLCLFLRRDLEPLEEERPAVFDEATLRNPKPGEVDFPGPEQPLALGWRARVGTKIVPTRAASDERRVTSDESSAGKTLVTRHPSLVTIDGESGAFTIDTPRTAGGFAESGAHQAGPLRFEIVESQRSKVDEPLSRAAALRDEAPLRSRSGHLSDDTHTVAAATVWVSSLDGKPIESSSHLLLTHLTDIQNSGIEYADAALTTLVRWGGLPHIMRRGSARIELSLDARRSAGANEVAQQSCAIKGALRANEVRGSAANDDGAARQMPNTSLPLEERPVIDGGSNSVAATVYRLSSSGKRLGEVTATWDAATGRLSFTARTDWDPTAATYLYEIVRD